MVGSFGILKFQKWKTFSGKDFKVNLLCKYAHAQSGGLQSIWGWDWSLKYWINSYVAALYSIRGWITHWNEVNKVQMWEKANMAV